MRGGRAVDILLRFEKGEAVCSKIGEFAKLRHRRMSGLMSAILDIYRSNNLPGGPSTTMETAVATKRCDRSIVVERSVC